MNKRIIAKVTGRILVLEAFLMMLPLVVSLIYHEDVWIYFGITCCVTAAFGSTLALIKVEKPAVYAKEGFAIVAFSWIGMSLFGALPFYLSGAIPSYIDALFETISGLTTTGASILTSVEHLSYGLLFWRSFTHWIGGMGVLVLIMAVMPSGNHSMHIMRAEVPGPTVGKLMPKIKDTAKMLYTIYLTLTLVEIALLLFGGMPLFDSIVHSFGTAGTGGFSIKNASIAAYPSPYIHWVITIFMILFGVNFNLYYFILLGNVKHVLKSEELRAYLGIIAASITIITINILPMYKGILDALQYSAFQVASIITTTGYATCDFNLWPELSKFTLLLLMFCGSCAGSTGGGLKVSRLLLMWKSIKREVNKMLHPRSVKVIKMDDKTVDEKIINSVNVFFALYMLIAAVSVLLLSFDNLNFETNFTAMAACLNNVGPGFSLVGATGNYSHFSDFSKIVLSVNMLLGRLEIYPILLMMIPFYLRPYHAQKNVDL